MSYFFTSESVSDGHPDKIADQISDGILDHFLAYDPNSKVACETLVTTGQVVLAGEVKSKIYLDTQEIVRNIINTIGYTKNEYKFNGDSCGIISLIHEQSSDILQGVEKQNKKEQGAGDQGIMFGYATNETEDYIPLSLYLCNKILQELAIMRRGNEEIKYLRPDAKSQVTLMYNSNNKPVSIYSIVISTQHDVFDSDDEKMLEKIKKDIIEIVIPRVKSKLPLFIQRLFTNKIIYHINPTGKFVIGGPHGDSGLTGRKIIVDTYGGRVPHGGGAFSGKDPSKVDRSAAYACRHIAKNLVAAKVADEVLIQIGYAIGVAEPISIYINTYGSSKISWTDSEIAKKVLQIFDLRPYAIESSLKLRNPIYLETASYGHMGRKSEKKKKKFNCIYNGFVEKEVELFTWEKLDFVEKIKKILL